MAGNGVLCHRDIQEFSAGLGVPKEVIQECMAKTAEENGITQEEVCDALLSHMRSIVADTVRKTAKKGFAMKDYQYKALEHMFRFRGLVIAFDVGAGKTLTAASISYALLKQAEAFGAKVKVYVITPTSLQENFRKELKSAGFLSDKKLAKRYHFYTITGFANAQKKGEIDCAKSLVIVDEAHNLRTDYRGIFGEVKVKKEVKGSTKAENVLMCTSEAWKVVLLTATPMYNSIYDVVNLAAMVRREAPLNAIQFENIRTNPTKFQEYFGCMFAFFKPSREEFPKRINRLVKIIMPPSYLEKYEAVERGLGGPGRTEKQREGYKIKVRKATNDLEPCIKCEEILKIVGTGEKTLIYSFFKSSGVEIVQKLLDAKGIKYVTITGNTPQKKRSEYVQEINDDEAQVIFITKAGGEGLDLKGIRHVIIMEQGWNKAGDEQVIGRAIRFRSHAALPPEKRNVTVHYLLALKPGGEKMFDMDSMGWVHWVKNHSVSVDQFLFVLGMSKQRTIDETVNMLDQISILKNVACEPNIF